MRTLHHSFPLALAILVAGVPASRAQQQPAQQTPQQSQPVPALRSPLASVDDQDAQPVSQDIASDTRSLAGALDLSLGAPKTAHSFWQPNFNVGVTLDSNPQNSTNNVGWTTWSSFLGGVDLHRISGNSNLTLTYLGGGSISNDGSSSDAVVQQLQLIDTFTFRRYSLTFIDQLGYLPESGAAGYVGGIAGGLPGVLPGSNQGLQNGFSPDQSILTSQGQRISNTSIGEFDTFLTKRSTVTLVGSYGILHFFDNDLENTNEIVIQAGYNYQLTRKDTIALMYVFSGFRYDNAPQSINSHSVQFSYARRVTGKLAFQIAAGPSVSFSNFPITSSTGEIISTTGTSANTTQVLWTMNSSLTYQLRRNLMLGASYSHGVSGGSGVLAGSVSDNAGGSVSRQLTRTLRGALTFGYSRNSGAILTSTSPTTFEVSNATYDYLFGGVNFARGWGRWMNLGLGYQLQYQNSNTMFCITTPCGTSYLQNEVTFSFGWRPGPRGF